MDAQRQHDGFLDFTVEVWQPRLARRLSRDDARQMASDVAGFFGLLVAWAEAETEGCLTRDATAEVSGERNGRCA